MRILIVGAGAVGGYFGARLAQAGRNVTFLVREKRAAQLRREGLKIQSPHGDLTLEPRLVTAAALSAPYDLILLSVKAYGLDAAMTDFAPAVGPQTMILPALNGMRHLKLLIERFGESAVIGGVCMIIAEALDDGRIVQMTDMQTLIYGERDGAVSPRLEAAHAAMQGAAFEARLSDAIMQDMWEKWLMLSSLGAITCLMRGAIGEIEATPGGAELELQLFGECAAIAAACGYPPRESPAAFMRGMLTAKGSKLTSSMYRDLAAGRRVEADHIVGDLLARGRDHGLATPLLAAAYANLAVYQNRL